MYLITNCRVYQFSCRLLIYCSAAVAALSFPQERDQRALCVARLGLSSRFNRELLALESANENVVLLEIDQSGVRKQSTRTPPIFRHDLNFAKNTTVDMSLHSLFSNSNNLQCKYSNGQKQISYNLFLIGILLLVRNRGIPRSHQAPKFTVMSNHIFYHFQTT